MLREIDKNTTDELKFEEFQKLLKKQEEKLREGEDELIDAFRGTYCGFLAFEFSIAMGMG